MKNETPILLVANLICLTLVMVKGYTGMFDGLWLVAVVGLVIINIRMVVIHRRSTVEAAQPMEAAELSE